MDISKKTNTIIGYLAGSCSAFAFIPQVWDVFKTKTVHGIYLLTLVIFFIGQILWIIHGIYSNDDAIVVFACITAFLYIFLIYAKLKF